MAPCAADAAPHPARGRPRVRHSMAALHVQTGQPGLRRPRSERPAACPSRLARLPLATGRRSLRPMARERTPPRRSALLSFRFLGASLVGSLTMALVSAFAPPPAQVAVLGALVSILGGLFLAYLEQDEERGRRQAELVEKLSVPLALAPDPELYARYSALCRALTELAGQADPVLRGVALLKLSSLAGQLGELAGGTVVFAGTEGWRTVYEQLLGSPDIREYRSVAWVRSKDYWQDQPGRQSMRVNFEAAHRGVLVERVVVLRDELWPRGQALPSDELLPWVEE